MATKEPIKVLYGGAFDLLHLGHIRALKQAATHGSHLIVNVNSDIQVRNKKGADRPVVPGAERAEILEHLFFIDKVIYLEYAQGNNIAELLDLVNPQILIVNKGENEKYNEVARAACAIRGIEVIEQERIIIPSGLDTTKIIEKIRSEA